VNIFVLDYEPELAAMWLCDKHVVKMPVESAQMMASALRRHGATDDDMPLTKSGTPYRGGYKHHPCTVWAGECQANFWWLFRHAREICRQYSLRYNKVHACEYAILSMGDRLCTLPGRTKNLSLLSRTDFVQAMPDELKRDCPVEAYRNYYRIAKRSIAKYRLGNAPEWLSQEKSHDLETV